MQTSAPTTDDSGTAKSSRRLAAAVAALAATAALAGPTVVSAYSAQDEGRRVAAGCPEWMCGTNHNEVMAGTAVR